MERYTHPFADWPRFRWDRERLVEPLAAVSRQQGRFIGHMEALSFHLRQEAIHQTLTADVLKTNEIEGEKLDAEQVSSSIARHLGMDIAGLKPADRDVEGIVEMMLDATRNYKEPLTRERLFAWHASLFLTGRNGMGEIKVGAAPRLEGEMTGFLEFFNREDRTDPLLKAALAHLWFVTIHPFDDGNGRIARAIADMQLARSEDSAQRFYSMSAQIREERKAYYDILEQTQHGTMDITPWMEWFLACLDRAIARAQKTLGTILEKARIWERLRLVPLNERQTLVLNCLLHNFEGKLTTVKWAKLTKCSHDTALRDIHDLIAQGILIQNPGGGRSVSYSLAEASRIGNARY